MLILFFQSLPIADAFIFKPANVASAAPASLNQFFYIKEAGVMLESIVVLDEGWMSVKPGQRLRCASCADEFVEKKRLEGIAETSLRREWLLISPRTSVVL